MRIRVLCLALLLSLCAIGVGAQTNLLPDQAGPWKTEGPGKALHAQDLVGKPGQPANFTQILKESSFSHAEERAYRNGTAEATVRVLVFKDPSSAYEFYTSLLAPEPQMKALALGDAAAASQAETNILAGNLVTQATLPPSAKPGALAELVNALKAKADHTPFPPLRSYLPEKWRVPGTERYALGPEAFRAAMTSLHEGANVDLTNAVGFQNGAEAILARYQGEHGSGTLLLIEYPTPHIAESHLHHLEEAFSPTAKAAGATVERKSSLLSVVFSPTSPMHAQAIRDEVNYETEITWNEPSTTATDPPLVLVLFKIFLFTSLFLIVATVAGVFFGGVRVLVKHWLPGKVFDRPQDIEVLQLGLSGKKIDPTDMY